MQKVWQALAISLMTAPVLAAELSVTAEIPQLDVAEYHRPYVAFWIEQGGSHVANLGVWYDLDMREDEGEQWLKDMRQWWRKSGRSLDMPVDGVSGATRVPGRHTLSFTDSKAPLSALAAGEYVLVTEAAREVGGRELVKIAFTWPPTAETSLNATGETELGEVVLQLQP